MVDLKLDEVDLLHLPDMQDRRSTPKSASGPRLEAVPRRRRKEFNALFPKAALEELDLLRRMLQCRGTWPWRWCSACFVVWVTF